MQAAREYNRARLIVFVTSATATESQLVRISRRWRGIVARKARMTESARAAWNRLQHPVEREIAQGIDAEVGRDLALRVVGGDQLLA